jgi:uncharacterized membrane protein
MNLYAIGLFVHISAAIVLIGGSLLASPAIRAAVLRAHTLPELRAWLGAARPLATINPTASIALVASGLYLAQAGGWWSAAWVQVALSLWLVNTAVAAGIVKPAMHELAVTVAGGGDGPVGPDVDRLRRTRRWSVGHHVLLANDLGVLYLMTTKPGYLGSVVALVASHGMLAATPALHRAVRRPRRDAATPAVARTDAAGRSVVHGGAAESG